jgi:hypothetical protein
MYGALELSKKFPKHKKIIKQLTHH